MKLLGQAILLATGATLLTVESALPKWKPKPNMGMFALTNGEEVPVPQMSMDVAVKVTANVASSEITIKYKNPSRDTTIDVGFKFPVDVDTALYKFVAKYDDKPDFELKVKELEAAKQEYLQAKVDGWAAVLAMQDKENHDIIKLNVSNIAPQGECTVTIHTVQRLHVISSLKGANGGYLKYKFATSLFSRYKLCPHENIKHPDCMKINKNENSLYGGGRDDILIHPKFTFRLTNALNTNLEGRPYSSYSLALNGKRPKLNQIQVDYCDDDEDCQYFYSLSGSSKPYSKDGDIVLFLPLTDLAIDSHKNKVAIQQGRGRDAITMYSHYISTTVLEEYTEENGSNEFSEYIFIVDNSHSMNYEVYGTWEQGTIMEKGQRMANAKLSLEQIINHLPETGHTYFNIIKFGCEFELLYSSGSKRLSTKSKREAMNYIKAMDADMHCTEILRPIEKAVDFPTIPQIRSEGGKKNVFVITDGDVNNQTQIFNYIQANTDKMRVFTVGIGAGASSALVKGMARAGKGYSAFITETKDADKEFLGARSMAETISRSLLAGSMTQIKNVQLNGETFPSFVDDVVTSGRFITIFSGATSSRDSQRKKRAAQGRRGGLTLSYDIVSSNGDEQPQAFDFEKTTRHRAMLHDGALKAMEAKLELQQMHREYLDARHTHGLNYGAKFESTYNRQYRYEDTSDSRDKKAGMISYSEETNVLCPFTAFVGVQNICPRGQRTCRDANAVEVPVSTEIKPPSGPGPSVRTGETAQKVISSLGDRKCGGIGTKGQSVEQIAELNENCGYWNKENAEEVFKLIYRRGKHQKRINKDWKKQVSEAKEAECGHPENVVSTAWHLVYLFHKYPKDSVFYRVVTRDAIDYMVSDGCEEVYNIVADALKAYESWGKVKGATQVQKARYPRKCDVWSASSSNKCDIYAEIDALDIIGMQYQTLTSAQHEADHTWDMDFLENVFNIRKDDFMDVVNWCSTRKGKKKKELCMGDLPTAIAVGLLYGRYPNDIEDWRLSVRLGMKSMKFPNQYLMSKVFKAMDVDVNPIEIFMINTY